MTPSIDRRTFVRGGAVLAIAALTPVPANAKDQLVVATFPGTWNEVHREILAPYFQKKTNADVTQTIMLATDQVAKLAATRGQPPFDVAIRSEEHTSELQSPCNLVCRLLLEKKNNTRSRLLLVISTD